MSIRGSVVACAACVRIGACLITLGASGCSTSAAQRRARAIDETLVVGARVEAVTAKLDGLGVTRYRVSSDKHRLEVRQDGVRRSFPVETSVMWVGVLGDDGVVTSVDRKEVHTGP